MVHKEWIYAAILSALMSFVFLFSPPPRNFPISVCDSCTTRLSFDGEQRHVSNTPNSNGDDEPACSLEHVDHQLISASIVLGYAAMGLSIVTLTSALIVGRSRVFSLLVLCTSVTQSGFFSTLLTVSLRLDCIVGSAVYLQAIIVACWGGACIWCFCFNQTKQTVNRLTGAPTQLTL